MSANAQPVLGYPSKSAAAAALQAEGLKQREIAARIGVKPSSVGNLTRTGRREAGEPDMAHYTAALNKTNRDRLRRAARARGTTMRSLVNELLTVVAEDGLIDAILDDGERQ